MAEERVDLIVSPDRDDAHHAHKTVAAVARTAGVRWWSWGLWRDLARPTIYVPFGDRRLAELQHVLAAHRGELARNDFPELMRARAIASRVLGAERVFGFGSSRASDEPYAELSPTPGRRGWWTWRIRCARSELAWWACVGGLRSASQRFSWRLRSRTRSRAPRRVPGARP